MTTEITTRAAKGAPLTYLELDENFENLRDTADAAFDATIGLGGKANASAVGVAASATNMGVFTGSTIPDGQTAKEALQAVETALESKAPLSDPAFTGTVTIDGSVVERRSSRGIADGYAPLGPDNKVPSAYLPDNGSYKGNWDATTNTPTITAGVGTNGDTYTVSVAGTQSVTGSPVAFGVGDNLRFTTNGNKWERIPNTQLVSSVAGKTGTVTLVKADVGLSNVDNTSDAAKPVSTAQQTALDLKAPIASPTFTGTTTASNAVDGAEVFRLGTSRPWSFYQRGAGALAQLHLENITGKTIFLSNGTPGAQNIEIRPEDAGAYIKVNGSLLLSASALALGTGASGVGWLAPGTGGATRTQAAKNADVTDPRDYGAVGNGSTNDRTALFNADAGGAVRITKPYRVSSNLTFTNQVTFAGGWLVIDTGVTVTFAGGIVAPRDKQIFKGLGGVAGLFEAWFEWFAADIRTTGATMPSTDCRLRFQLAHDSVAPAGVVWAGAGNWLYDGATATALSAGQSFEGSGYGTRGTYFYWSGVARNFITKIDLGAGTRGGIIRNFALAPLDRSTVATTSTAINVNQSDVMVRDVVITNPYNGITFNTMVIGRAHNTKISGPVNAGYLINNSLDVFINQWNVSAGYDIVTMTGAPTGGDFVVGEVVNCPTGSNGTIVEVFSATKYGISWVGIAPPVAGTINATGKTATVSTVSVPCQGGHIRMTGTNESVVIGQGDGVGGRFGLRVVGAGSAGRIAGNSGYNVIEAGAYFDSTYDGSWIEGGYGWVVGGWFATSRNQNANGLLLTFCRQITGSPRCENNAGSGIKWQADSKNIYLTAPQCVGNGRNYSSSNTADITVAGAATNWSINQGIAGHPNLGGVSAPKGLYIDNAAAGDFSVIGLDVPAGAVTNSSTADSQYWFAVAGVPWRVDKSGLSNAANDAAAAAASVPIGGIYRNGSVMMIRMV